MKKICLIVTLIVAFGVSQAYAANTKGYVGLSYGKSDLDTGITSLTGTASLDEEDNGYKIFGGYEINDYISIEGHYADMGEASLKGNTGDQFTSEGITYQFLVNNVSLTQEGTSLGLSGVFFWPVTEIIQPFAKVGMHRWDIDATLTSPLGSADFSDDGTDIFYGIGLSVSVIDNLSVRAEFERFDFDGDDVDYTSLGVAYSF